MATFKLLAVLSFIVLLAAKLDGGSELSWWLVASPLLAYVGFWAAFAALLGGVALIAVNFKASKGR